MRVIETSVWVKVIFIFGIDFIFFSLINLVPYGQIALALSSATVLLQVISLKDLPKHETRKEMRKEMYLTLMGP